MRLCFGLKPVQSCHLHVPFRIHRYVYPTSFRLHHEVCHRLTSPLSQLLSEVRSVFVPPCHLCQLPYVTVVLIDGINRNQFITESFRQGPVQPRYLGVIRPVRSSRIGQHLCEEWKKLAESLPLLLLDPFQLSLGRLLVHHIPESPVEVTHELLRVVRAIGSSRHVKGINQCL